MSNVAHTIRVKELSTPEAFVMRRIITSVGLNIRPQKATYDSQSRIWTVPLKAVVPSQVTSQNNTMRTFLYRFENIGSVKLQKDGDDYKVIEFPKVGIIDESLHSQWYDLTSKVEKEILGIGEPIWGELTYVRMLLRPMYTIIGQTITDHKLFLSELRKNPQQLKHVEFLKSREYLEFDEEKGSYTASNSLTMMAEKWYKKYDDDALAFIVTSKLVGSIFSKYYRDIKYQLGAHSPSVYVDTSMAYYIDAIRTREPIRMELDELWKKYRMIGHRPTYAEVGTGYPTVIDEMVVGKLLNTTQDGKIYANENVFNQLEPLGYDLSHQLVEIP